MHCDSQFLETIYNTPNLSVMSASKLLKNVEKRLPETRSLTSITWKPVVVSDSKGRYLKLLSANVFPEREIKWISQPGATTSQIYSYLRNNIADLVHQYQKIHIYVWTGTCDLTEKHQDRSISLKSGDPTESFKEGADRIIQLASDRSNVRLTFLHVPFFSISIWNKIKARSQQAKGAEDDQLTESVKALNSHIDSLNNRLTTYSPSLEQDMVRYRKRANSSGKYTINFSLLSDGVHPNQPLARSWLASICRRVTADCI